MDRALREYLQRALAPHCARGAQIVESEPVGGGCISASYRVRCDAREFFVKTQPAEALAMFEAEAQGLRALAAAQAVRVPQVLAAGAHGRWAWLVLEWLPLGGRPDWPRLGAGLARLHQCRGPHFGWPADNFIGATPQFNAPQSDWAGFFATQRLKPQFDWASERGAAALGRDGLRLCERVPQLLSDHAPAPALLHGDLWGGNVGFLSDGTPVIYDPASYWGDAETDLAMAHLFGGFSSACFAAYDKVSPPRPGAAERRALYQLYHVLNHFRLFGGCYRHQAEALTGRLLDAVR